MKQKENCYYVGIDIDDEHAVVSFYQTGQKEPETFSMVAGSEIYQIPVQIAKKGGIGQWYIGADAKKAEENQSNCVVDRLLSRAVNQEVIEIEGEGYQAEQLLTLFLRKIILAASGIGTTLIPDKLAFTVETVSEELICLLKRTGQKIGLNNEDILIIDRKESFYFFAYHQKQELWLHDIYLFDFSGQTLKSYGITRNQRTNPQVISISEQECLLEQEQRDEQFYQILQKQFRGKIISTSYLVGDGFEGEWMKLSLAYLCKGRRAFIGKNLYSKGACYAIAKDEWENEWPFVYIGDNELKFNISLKVINQGKTEFLSFLTAGENWYDAKGECEVILDGTPEISFWLQYPNSRDAKIEKLELSDLPKRENRTTRLRISAKPVSDCKVKVIIKDMGFGEIVRSSEKSWEYMMTL